MKIKEPRLKRRLILIGTIICLALIIVAVILNREQDIEQYYINSKYYDKLDKITLQPRLVINNYSDYIEKFADNSEITTLLQNVVDKNFFNTKSLIVLDDNQMASRGREGHISKVNIENNTANITIKRDYRETYFDAPNFGKSGPEERSYFIPINNKNITEVNIEYEFSFDIWYGIDCVLRMSPLIILVITIIKFVKTKKKIKRTITDVIDEEFETKKAIKKLISGIVVSGVWRYILEAFTHPTFDKPIIYLYPEKNQELSVKLGYKDKIIVSYPKYTTGWKVLAKPNGDLIDLNTNKQLYSLYYESDVVYKFKVERDGFIVKEEDTVQFLEDKLPVLGLTYKEAEEFIIYWLPRLQKNKYNYIRFATMDEINQNMPLEFSVKPDSLIRVLMTYKGLNRPIEVKEQELETPNRTGFVAVEWGGTEIK